MIVCQMLGGPGWCLTLCICEWKVGLKSWIQSGCEMFSNYEGQFVCIHTGCRHSDGINSDGIQGKLQHAVFGSSSTTEGMSQRVFLHYAHMCTCMEHSPSLSHSLSLSISL